MMWCPTVFLGYAMMLGTSFHPAGHPPAMHLEAQTCSVGAGAYVNGTTNGLYASGVQYGFVLSETHSPIQVTLTPHAGLSYTDHDVRNLPSRSQYDIGAGLYVSYGQFISGVKYAHYSNGHKLGMCWSDRCNPNLGLDMIIVQTGMQF